VFYNSCPFGFENAEKNNTTATANDRAPCCILPARLHDHNPWSHPLWPILSILTILFDLDPSEGTEISSVVSHRSSSLMKSWKELGW